jgi:hypothetical protein
VLDHHHGIRSARDRPARGDGGGRAGRDDDPWTHAAGDGLGVEPQGHGRELGGRRQIGGAHREAVDTGAVEGRHVDGRGDVGGQHATQGLLQAHGLDPPRRGVEGLPKTPHRLRAGQDGEELVLGQGPVGGFQAHERESSAKAAIVSPGA